MRGPTTMQQIADELGLSRVTVSSVLNGRDGARGISAATAALVREHVARRGYVPNRQARALRQPSGQTVGILYGGGLFSHLTEAFNRIVDGTAASPDRLEIMVVRRGELLGGIRELVARGVRRLVWIVGRWDFDPAQEPEAMRYLANIEVIVYNFPFGDAALDARFRDYPFHLVGVDRQAGFRRLGAFLHALGHRRVALPEVAAHESEYPRRTALTAAGLEAVATRPPDSPADNSAAIAAGLAAAVARREVTAACFYDDLIAGLTLAELAARGIRVPEMLTVTGFDGMPFTAAVNPPLTTLAVPVDRLVQRVRELLDRPGRDRRHLFDLELIVHQSHGPAPGRGCHHPQEGDPP